MIFKSCNTLKSISCIFYFTNCHEVTVLLNPVLNIGHLSLQISRPHKFKNILQIIVVLQLSIVNGNVTYAVSIIWSKH